VLQPGICQTPYRKGSNHILRLFGIAFCFIKIYLVCHRLLKKKSVDVYRLLKMARVKNRVLLKVTFYLPYVVGKLLTWTSSTY